MKALIVPTFTKVALFLCFTTLACTIEFVTFSLVVIGSLLFSLSYQCFYSPHDRLTKKNKQRGSRARKEKAAVGLVCVLTVTAVALQPESY